MSKVQRKSAITNLVKIGPRAGESNTKMVKRVARAMGCSPATVWDEVKRQRAAAHPPMGVPLSETPATKFVDREFGVIILDGRHMLVAFDLRDSFKEAFNRLHTAWTANT